MTNFKKNDKVFYIRDWNRMGVVRIVEGVVKSFGKKQATVLVGEEMLKTFIYDCDYMNMFSSKEEAVAAAKILGQKAYDRHMSVNESDKAGQTAQKGKDFYQGLIDQANEQGVCIEYK